MITAEHERPHAAHGGSDGFEDSVTVEFCDGESELFGLLRIARRPTENRAEMLAVVCVDGEIAAGVLREDAPLPETWDRAEAAGATLRTVAPLERWAAALDAGGTSFEVDLTAASAPVDLGEGAAAEVSRTIGIQGYEQLCEVRGSVSAAGRSRAVAGSGRRVHTWGVPAPGPADSARSLFAAGGDSALTVSAVRPAGAEGHDRELIAGRGAFPGVPDAALEGIRLSTVYDAAGRPREAGLEVVTIGGELPRRITGEAACGFSLDNGGTIVSIAFFRWRIGGASAWGSYQTVTRT